MEIGNFAFFNCVKLSSVTIPENMHTIGKHAFQNCRNIKTLTIPATVTDINDNAFDGWLPYQKIHVNYKTKPEDWSHEWNKNCNAEIIWQN